LYLTTHNAYQWQTSMPPAGIKPSSPSKRAATDPRLRWRGNQDQHSSIDIPVTPTSQESRHELPKKIHRQIRKSNGR
jgi:hypothetical protein